MKTNRPIALFFQSAVLAGLVLTGCDGGGEEDGSGGGATPEAGLYRIDTLAESEDSCTGKAMDLSAAEHTHVIVRVEDGMFGNSTNLYWCTDEAQCRRDMDAMENDEDDSAELLGFFIGSLSGESTFGFSAGGDLCTVTKKSEEVSYDGESGTLSYVSKSSTREDVPKKDGDFCLQDDDFDYGDCNGTVTVEATLLD